ncbi:MAG: hypothetical protein KF787_13820 [Phycisphaeraceae bacterium]|nr:hypothetical protein [Phycisphaerae bacterium]MBX3393713.1 hypothetical protein [Phycisphaeraceae bacterium]
MITSRPRFVSILPALLAAALPAACGSRPDQTAPDHRRGGQDAGSSQVPTPAAESPVPTFSPETVKLLSVVETAAVAVVECESVSIRNEGTRSREAVMKARVVAPGRNAPSQDVWTLSWYTQGEPAVKAGLVYLVAAEAQGASWTLLEAVEASRGNETRDASAATTLLDSLKRPSR